MLGLSTDEVHLITSDRNHSLLHQYKQTTWHCKQQRVSCLLAPSRRTGMLRSEGGWLDRAKLVGSRLGGSGSVSCTLLAVGRGVLQGPVLFDTFLNDLRMGVRAHRVCR